MTRFFIVWHGWSIYTLPMTAVFWFAFYFMKQYKLLLITSVVLLIFDLDFIVSIPFYLADPFRYLRFMYYEIIAFVIGIWGMTQTLPIILKGDSVVDTWSMIVEQGAGRDQWMLNTTEEYIDEAQMPNVAYYQDYVSNAWFGTTRKCLIVAHLMYKDYKMYITARNFGVHLDVSWFLAVQPGLMKRTLSKYSTGNPQALSQQIDMFDQQDIRAFVSISHHALQRAIDILLEELKQEPIGSRAPQSKGFLSVW